MKNKSYPFLFLLLACTLPVFNCCKKSDTVQAEVVISSIAPDNGSNGTLVTITGSGFSGNNADNIVTFNGKTAVVQSSTSTQIVAVVPKAAGTGPVTVQYANKNAQGANFYFMFTAMTSTFAGNPTQGFADGNGVAALFNYVAGIAADKQGNIFVADCYNNRIRKITPEGVVTTVAGAGTKGLVNGSSNTALFNNPNGVAADGAGNVYVADTYNHCIRKISANGNVTTVAGTGTAGFADGDAATAQFSLPLRLVLDPAGNIYISDGANQRIRKISVNGTVSTIAGDGTTGYADGTGTAAQFYAPWEIAIDPDGNLYVGELSNHVRKITPAGVVTTLAGSGVPGTADGNGMSAQFNAPTGLVVGEMGNVYVADQFNNRIRKITSSGQVTTMAGSYSGFLNGSGNTALFNQPVSLATNINGNIFVADIGNNVVRKIVME